MIKNLHGWGDYEFDEVFTRLRLKTCQIPSGEYQVAGKHPIVDQGKQKIVGYSDRLDPYDGHPFIIFGDHTCEIKFVDFPTFLGADGTQPIKTTDRCDLRFGFYLLKNVRLPDLGYSRYFRELKEQVFSLPTLPEQRKIADILTTWDEAIETLDALIAAKARQKQALMQQLLTGKTRVKGARGKWKKLQLGEMAENRSDQNKGKLGTELLYGVTKADGVVPMRDHVKGESFHRCKLLEHDWFAYNPMRINIGSIARWQGNKTVMVSGDYVVFRCFEDRLSPAYLDHLRQSWMWHSFVTKGGNGSVRIRIYFSDLEEFTFPCPPLAEQQQIAAILDTADQELLLLRTQRQTLDQQKRGLMQRLLTGKIRVKVSTK